MGANNIDQKSCDVAAARSREWRWDGTERLELLLLLLDHPWGQVHHHHCSSPLYNQASCASLTHNNPPTCLRVLFSFAPAREFRLENGTFWEASDQNCPPYGPIFKNSTDSCSSVSWLSACQEAVSQKVYFLEIFPPRRLSETVGTAAAE